MGLTKNSQKKVKFLLFFKQKSNKVSQIEYSTTTSFPGKNILKNLKVIHYLDGFFILCNEFFLSIL